MQTAHDSVEAVRAHTVLRVLLPFCGAYFLSYVYRSVNAIIAPDLVHAFALSPADLGLVTSAYFLSFAAFQLPLGLLLDRFGPRRTDAMLVLLAAIGAVVFAYAHNVSTLVLGRALLGLGVSGCLMSGMKANVLWFPLARLPAMNGWLFFTGGLGMIAATMPVQLALRYTDWRTLFLFLAALTVLASLVLMVTVPERGRSERETLSAQLAGLRRVFADPVFRRVALVAATIQSTSMAVQGLWAAPWMRDVAKLSRETVALHMLVMACATTLGFVLGQLLGADGAPRILHSTSLRGRHGRLSDLPARYRIQCGYVLAAAVDRLRFLRHRR